MSTTVVSKLRLTLILGLAALMLAALSSRFVGAAQRAARVTEVVLRSDDARLAGTCPVTVRFSGHITSDGPGTVTYTFTRSDGASGPTRTLEFKEAGTQPVSTTWTLGDAQSPASYEGWQALRVLSPNELESSRAAGSFVLTCGAPRPEPSPEKKVEEKQSVGNGIERLVGELTRKGVAKLSEAQAAEKKKAGQSEKVVTDGSTQTGAEKSTDLTGTSVSAASVPGRQTDIISRTPPYATSVNPPHASMPTIYVADPISGRVVSMRDMSGAGLMELQVPPAGTFAARVRDALTYPLSVAVDRAGRIYVGDRERIVRVDDISGANWRSLGGFGEPSGIFVDSAYRIYVADAKRSEIVRFNDMNGTGRVTFRGSGDQRLLIPRSVTVDDAGRIYIADSGNHRIVRIDDMTGAGWVSCCGGDRRDPKTGLVQDTEELLNFPQAIALDARGRIYITTAPSTSPLSDEEGNPIYEINPAGPEVTHYSVIRIDDMTGAGRVSYSRQRGHWEPGERSGVNQFALPFGIALDRAGRIYIADYGASRVARIDDLNGAGWVAVHPHYCVRASIPNCTPKSIVVSDVGRPGTLSPPEDLSPLVAITSIHRGSSYPRRPRDRGAITLPSFDMLSPVVRAVIGEDVGLRSLSVQFDNGPLMPMPVSRDPEFENIYHGQLRAGGPALPAVWDPSFLHTLRVVATDTAGRTGEDWRQFRSVDDRRHLWLWLDATDDYSVSRNGTLVHEMSDRRDPLYLAGSAQFQTNEGERSETGRVRARGRAEAVMLDGQRALRFKPGLEGLTASGENLAGGNYTIFAVVRRESIGESFPIVQPETACNGGRCGSYASLHLGWQDERTLRFSHHFNDLDLDGVPPLSPSPVRSLIVARAGPTTRYLSLDEPGFSRSVEKPGTAVLRAGVEVRLGGSGADPGFQFTGNIFEVIIYNESVSDELMNRVKAYLKAKYRI